MTGHNDIRFTVRDDVNGEWLDTDDCMFAIMGDGTKLLITKDHDQRRLDFGGPYDEPMFSITKFEPDSRYHVEIANK